jgi:hypothetical protein
VAKPFKNILKKEMPFDWEEDQQKNLQGHEE